MIQYFDLVDLALLETPVCLYLGISNVQPIKLSTDHTAIESIFWENLLK